MVKNYLTEKGVKYIEYDVASNTIAAQKMIRLTGQRGVPVTVINGEVIIGYDVIKIEKALRLQQLTRPLFGAAITDADRLTEGKDKTQTFGAYIGRVRPGSLADKLGLVTGDIVIDISGQSVCNASDMETILNLLPPGSQISLSYKRNGEIQKVRGNFP